VKLAIALSEEALRDIREVAAGDRFGWKMDTTGSEIIDTVTAILPLGVGDYVAVPPQYAPPEISDVEDAPRDALVMKTYGAGWWRGRIAFMWGAGLVGVARPWSGPPDGRALSHVDVPVSDLRYCA